MLVKTKGICLKYTRYRDTSIIVKIFTEELGLGSYIINNIRSSRSKRSINSFQPLTILDLVVYNHPIKSIQRLSEYRSYYGYRSIPYDTRKIAIALFICEFLNKLLNNYPEEDNRSFKFLVDSFVRFDELKSEIEIFHLYFLVQLSRYYGVGINSLNDIETHVDLPRSIDKEKLKSILEGLITGKSIEPFMVSRDQRLTFLNMLIEYFHYHFDNISNLKSMKILHQVFN